MQQAALETAPPPSPPEVSPLPVPETETGSITLPRCRLKSWSRTRNTDRCPRWRRTGAVRSTCMRGRRATRRPRPRPVPRRASPFWSPGSACPDGPPGDVIEGLPAPISVAYGAYGRSLQDGVTKARADGHEVLLQIPLEPNNYPSEDPGPHTLLTTLPPQENMKRLQWLMSRYTGYVGVTNHMGAKFEARDGLVRAGARGAETARPALCRRRQHAGVAHRRKIANTIGLEYSVVSVQIDGGQSAAEIAKQLAKLEAMAKEQGTAIGVVRLKPRRRKAARRLGQQARGQRPRAGAGQRRRAVPAAELIVVSMTEQRGTALPALRRRDAVERRRPRLRRAARRSERRAGRRRHMVADAAGRTR